MSLTRYYRIYKLIGEGRLRFYGLNLLRTLRMRYLVVKLDPNYLCNLRCKSCYFSSEGAKKNFIQPMSPEFFKKVADAVFPKTRILFLGCAAEPLVTPSFDRYADIIGRHSIPLVCIVTNGQLMDAEVSESMIRNGFHQVIVSIDGSRKETYEALRVGAKFERLMENLKALRDAKARAGSRVPDLRFNFTAMRSNIEEIEGVVDIARDVGAATLRVRYLTPWGGALDYEAEVLPKAQYMARMKDAHHYAGRQGIELLYEGCFEGQTGGSAGKEVFRPFECILPWYSMHIRGDGKMRVCSWHRYEDGDFSAQTFREVDGSESMRRMRRLLLKNPEESCLGKCKGNFGGL